MANYQTLKAAINAVIKANGNKEITGTVLNEVLLAMVNSLGAGYQFSGVATPSTNPGTPDQKVFYIASQAGTYTNFGGAVVSDGIAIFEWNGIWTTETLDLPIFEQVQSDWTETDTAKKSYIKHKPNIPEEQVQSDWTETDTTKKSYIKHKPNIPPSANVDPVPTEDSPNAVSSGGTYDMIVHTAATLFGDIQDATNVNAIESVDGKIYDDYQAGDIFFIVDNNVRKYRVALVAGTADAEHPVTISPVNFYYALNSADAINLSLTLKTVSTEQQSLSSQQKAQARTNIAAVSYDQQSLNADQQVQAQNNMMGKAYAPAQNSGLGKVYLDKNNGVLTQAMMPIATQEGEEDPGRNTVYVIQYDYTMSGNITVPAGCTLEFDGGSISGNYTLTGKNTCIIGNTDRIFGHITIDGTWDVPKISTSMLRVNENNIIKQLFNLCNDNVYNEVSIGSGNYTVDTVGNDSWSSAIELCSNTRIEIKGSITLNTNSFSHYAIFRVFLKNNIIISGGTLIGDKTTHTGTDGESGFAISVDAGENIIIRNTTLKNCWGDGICIAGVDTTDGYVYSKNVDVLNCTITACRRQGISVVSCENCIIDNCIIYNIGGTDPGYGIDIEPAKTNGITRNIEIRNIEIYNCEGGVELYQYPNSFVENVKVSDSYIHDINSHCIFTYGAKNVLVDNCIFENNAGTQTIEIQKSEVITFRCLRMNHQVTAFAISVVTNSKDVTFENCNLITSAASNDGVYQVKNTIFDGCTIINTADKSLFYSLDDVTLRNSIIESVEKTLANNNSKGAVFENCTFNCEVRVYSDARIVNCRVINSRTILSGNNNIVANTIIDCSDAQSSIDYIFLFGSAAQHNIISDCVVKSNNKVWELYYTPSDTNNIFNLAFVGTLGNINYNGTKIVRSINERYPDPASIIVKYMTEYFNVSLGKPLWWLVNSTYPNGTWVDAAGNIIA